MLIHWLMLSLKSRQVRKGLHRTLPNCKFGVLKSEPIRVSIQAKSGHRSTLTTCSSRSSWNPSDGISYYQLERTHTRYLMYSVVSYRLSSQFDRYMIQRQWTCSGALMMSREELKQFCLEDPNLEASKG